MNPLSPQDHRAALETAQRIRRGDALEQPELDRLCEAWMPRLLPAGKETNERFAVVSAHGSPTGVAGPRWMFHLFGLRHRAVEIAFLTPAGLVVLQRRSIHKSEWPDAIDMAVAGHVSESDAGSDAGFLATAWREIEEEIGLPRSAAAGMLVEGRLVPIGEPYFCFEGDSQRNPPFLDAEVRQVYAATLTGDALASVRFADGEVDGLILTTVDAAWRTLRAKRIASGLRYSLPRFLDWLERRAEGRPGNGC
ncbi:MAG TPA: NUDIX domain-containing protein [Chthonomonadaceae bacterium]|nr:NUDIX domain-containing protein [Chthonomonadaceae bacterium]